MDLQRFQKQVIKTLIAILVLFPSSLFGEIVKTTDIPLECIKFQGLPEPVGCDALDFDGWNYFDTEVITSLGQWHYKTDYNSIEEVLRDKKLFKEKQLFIEHLYHKCIFKNLKTTMGDNAAALIKQSCKYKSKNPSWIDTKYYEWFVK